MKSYAYYADLSIKTKILNGFRKLFRSGEWEKFLLKKVLSGNQHSFWTKVIPAEYLYPKNSWRNYDRNGIKLKLDISNVVDHLKYFGYRDKGFLNYLDLLKPSYTILDIGGNIGVTCLEFAKIAKDGSVIVFEPSASNFKRLTENISLNQFNNIYPVNTGIGDTAGSFKLYNVVESNPGMKRVLDDDSAAGFDAETIHIDTLENQLNIQNVSRVHAMKIDVEGFEYKVLQSADAVLKNNKPILFIELDDRNLRGQNSDAAQLIKFLKGHQYEIFNAETPDKPISIDFDYTNCHFDIICR